LPASGVASATIPAVAATESWKQYCCVGWSTGVANLSVPAGIR
jgi:hypothetical protein